MVFANEDNAIQSRFSADFYNFLCIEFLRIEKCRVFIAESPFLIGVCIQSEMNDCIAACHAVPHHARRWNSALIEIMRDHLCFSYCY